MLAVTECTPCGRFDVVSTTPASTSGPCTPSQRHLDALAAKAGEKYGLARRQVRDSLGEVGIGDDLKIALGACLARLCERRVIRIVDKDLASFD